MSKNRKNQALSEELANRKADKKSTRRTKVDPTPKETVGFSTTEPKRRGRPKGSTNKKVEMVTSKSKDSTLDVKVKKQRKRRGSKPKIVKKKRLYGIIESIHSSKFELDYLVGRKVKIIQETDSAYFAIVQHPGYESLEIAFEKDEIRITGHNKVMEEFFES